MGGMNGIRAIEAYPDRIAAVGSFHGGRIVTDQPDSPHLRVGAITGELYLAHADHDRSMSADQIKVLAQRLALKEERHRELEKKLAEAVGRDPAEATDED